MNTYIHTHIHTHIHVCILRLHTYILTSYIWHTWVMSHTYDIYMCIHMYTHLYTCVRIHTCMYVCMYVRVHLAYSSRSPKEIVKNSDPTLTRTSYNGDTRITQIHAEKNPSPRPACECCVCVHVCEEAVPVCACVRVSVRVCTWRYIYIYIYTHIYVYIYVYMYTYIYTYICTYTWRSWRYNSEKSVASDFESNDVFRIFVCVCGGRERESARERERERKKYILKITHPTHKQAADLGKFGCPYSRDFSCIDCTCLLHVCVTSYANVHTHVQACA
jgi:hypothetical protein